MAARPAGVRARGKGCEERVRLVGIALLLLGVFIPGRCKALERVYQARNATLPA